MKKLFIAILAAMLMSGAFAQESFPDIPEGHWAGEAVDRIADLNIVIGFPDGTFRGNEAFTRYQAALVISRMLDVINENIEAALAMTNEDVASLRNAVQELSSDVAAQGTRLSAAEGAIAGLSDDVTGQAARLDDLESAIADIDTEVDPAVLQDLQNQISSQRVAADTAQATADQALARANAAGSLAEANAEEIAALNDLIQLLGDQIEGFDVEIPEFDTTDLEGRIARNEGDIANIREFVILLRRDQVALRDRVSALEASDEQQAADIADLQERVTAIEENPLGLSGTITLEYMVGRFTGAGDTFDIDRAYGVGMPRSMGESVFSSGTDDLDDDDEIEEGEFAEDLDDIEYGSDFEADVDVTLGSGSTFNTVGGLNSFEAAAIFTLERDQRYAGDVNGNGEVDFDEDFVEEEEYIIGLDEFTATFEPIGGDPLVFAFGEEIDVEFTPYTFNYEGVGFRATLGSPDFLSFIDPTLEIGYLTEDADDEAAEFVTTGARLTLNPLEQLAVGVTYVRHTSNVDGTNEILDEEANDTIFGVDVSATLGPVVLAGEYATASVEGIEADDSDLFEDDILYVTAETTLDILGGIEFAANYRDIANDWDTLVASGEEITDEDDYPFEEDQTGFAVDVGLGLFIFDVGVFYDTWTTVEPDASTDAFGVDAAAELFSGFSLTAFYSQVSVDGDVIDETVDNDDGGTERDIEYQTGFGVGLAHDGAAENALVPNLNLAFAYEQLGADFNETHILAAADYALDVSIVSLTPYVSYEMFDDADADSDDTTELLAGTGLVTEPLDVFFQPNVEAAVNYRSTSHSDVGDATPDYTATEMQWSVGLNLTEFLFDNSSLSVRYGSYSGTNVAYGDPIDADGDAEDDFFSDRADVYLADAGGSVAGYEVAWNYYGLELSYGSYTNENPDGDETMAQAFGVTYTVAF